MPYAITHKPTDVICQCGAIVKFASMQKHLLTAKHQRDVVGCENITSILSQKCRSCSSHTHTLLYILIYAFLFSPVGGRDYGLNLALGAPRGRTCYGRLRQS